MTTPAFDHTIRSSKSFDDAVAAVTASAKAHSFGVLHTHDLKEKLGSFGLEREPLKIIEVCNPVYAHEVLKKDVKIALMLPCPICVYVKDGETFVSTLKPSIIGDFFPEAHVGATAAEVEKAVIEIVNDAK